MPTILRRFLLWTLVCWTSAAPSFFWAHQEFDHAAMVLGVCFFIFAYTAATSTAAYEQFHRRPFVRRTLYIGYGLRIGLSLAFPIGAGVDMVPGMMSVSFVRNLGLDEHSFAGTLLTTCVQGALLNLILFFFMGIVYAIQRAFMRPPEEPRGFPVLPAVPVVPVMPIAPE